MILRCTCAHTYQDEKHGTGKRVYNKCAKTPATTYRCTVCLREQVK